MRYQAFALAVSFWVLGCESKKSTAEQPATRTAEPATQHSAPVVLTDLTDASTLAPVRAAFNAKKGEARFLTLLSPT